MTRRIVRKFTAEAVFVGCLFSFVVGTLIGLAAGLLIQSAGAGLLVGGVTFVFSLDVIFRGKYE